VGLELLKIVVGSAVVKRRLLKVVSVVPQGVLLKVEVVVFVVLDGRLWEDVNDNNSGLFSYEITLAVRFNCFVELQFARGLTSVLLTTPGS